MVWEHLDVNKPHLVYIILGAFTVCFMLVSSIIKEKLYIGEATVATVIGVAFGPIAANAINPLSWGNTDQITLEFARIVLVVQCFAVGVELPRRYMNKHWRSVAMLLVPVMGTGWLVVTLVIWWLFLDVLSFKEALCVAACVTATDPVLASSVVGKGKFAERVPKHLRDVLSAESGCNDGMAFPFIYLALYVLRYEGQAGELAKYWFGVTILYECVLGAFYGFMVGYGARRLIRLAHERDWIDRESFLVFYFVLALFCAGSGSILGIDDLLVGFAAGVGFSNDGWFQEKTEESHVSNVIDLLLNLTFFVYFGTIIPWSDFNNAAIGIQAWKLVVLSVFTIFFRRIPVVFFLKPLIPDIKTWREAIFAGHFGPIGVGAIFVAVLARAELEHESTEPMDINEVPTNHPYYLLIQVIWPITTWLVLTSIIIHGSSIAVFTLGKRINTLQLTFSYTTHLEDGATWMERLPRISSRKSSMSRPQSLVDVERESPGATSPEITGPVSPMSAVPRDFIRRYRGRSEGTSENRSRSNSRTTSGPFSHRRRKSKKVNDDAGGPVSQSAIAPVSLFQNRRPEERPEEEVEVYREGDDVVVEDQEGEVLETRHSPDTTDAEKTLDVEGDLEAGGIGITEERNDIRDAEKGEQDLEMAAEPGPAGGTPGPTRWWQRANSALRTFGLKLPEDPEDYQPPKRRGPARSYTFGNTIIIEDEDGEVIKQYTIPGGPASQLPQGGKKEGPLSKMLGSRGAGPSTAASWYRRPSLAGPSATEGTGEVGNLIATAAAAAAVDRHDLEKRISNVLREADDDEDHIRFTIEGEDRRLKKDEFINELVRIETNRAQRETTLSGETRRTGRSTRPGLDRGQSSYVSQRYQPATSSTGQSQGGRFFSSTGRSGSMTDPTVAASPESDPEDLNLSHFRTLSPTTTNNGLTPAQTHESVSGHVPTLHRPVGDALLSHFAFARGGHETAAQRRRRSAVTGNGPAAAAADDEFGRPRGPPLGLTPAPTILPRSRTGESLSSSRVPAHERTQASHDEDEEETPAERRRRVAALGLTRRRSRAGGDEDGGGSGNGDEAAGDGGGGGSTGRDGEFESETTSSSSDEEDDGTGLGFRRLPSAADRVMRSRASASSRAGSSSAATTASRGSQSGPVPPASPPRSSGGGESGSAAAAASTHRQALSQIGGPGLIPRSAANTQGSATAAGTTTPTGAGGRAAGGGMRLRWGEDVGRRPAQQ